MMRNKNTQINPHEMELFNKKKKNNTLQCIPNNKNINYKRYFFNI